MQPVAPLAPIQPDAPRPPARGSSNLQALGEALAGLNSKIAPALDSYFKAQNAEDGLEAELRAVRDNVSSWSEAVATDPSLADKSPYYRQVYEGRAARTAVQRRAGEVLAEYHGDPIATSEDPGAVQSWLAERFKPTLEGVTSPAARASALEELQKVQGQFATAHRTNAVQNLLFKNRQGVSSAMSTAFDNSSATPAQAFKTDDPVAANLTSPEKALLNAISGGESAGKYNIRYGGVGSPGKLFDLNGSHPNVAERRQDGRTSTAAGRYQFLASTWQRVMGDAPFTPENQDKAALKLARADYARVTNGGNLDADLEKEGFSPRIQRALAPTWEALKGNHGRHLATFNESLRRSGGKPSGPGADNPNVPVLIEDLRRIEAEAKAQGIGGKDLNELTLSAVTQAMVRTGDATLAEVALADRPDGTPGPGKTVEGRQLLDQARGQINSNRVKDENHRHSVQERERTARIRRGEGAIMDTLLRQIAAGEQPRLDPETVRKAAEVDPSLGEKAVSIQKSLSDFERTEDRSIVAAFSADLYAGKGTTADVLNLIASGTLRDPTTIRNLFEEARRNGNENVTAHPLVRAGLDDLRNLVGEPFETGILAQPERAVQASSLLRSAVLGFKERNHKFTEAELHEFVTGERDRIVRIYRPNTKLDEFRPENVGKPSAGSPAAPAQGGGPGGRTRQGAVTAPKPTTADPRQSSAVAPVGTPSTYQPKPGVDYRYVPVFPDLATLDREHKAFLEGDLRGNFGGWVAQLGVTSVSSFYTAQRRILAAGKR